MQKEIMMREFAITRRSLLGGTAALATASLAGKSIVGPAWARAPLTNTQAPSFYRFRIGAIEATVVSDGPLGPLGEPSSTFVGAPKEEIGRTLSDNFLSTDNMVFEQNALVANTGDRLVLFDTGMGPVKMLGPSSGRLPASLQAAGICGKRH